MDLGLPDEKNRLGYIVSWKQFDKRMILKTIKGHDIVTSILGESNKQLWLYGCMLSDFCPQEKMHEFLGLVSQQKAMCTGKDPSGIWWLKNGDVFGLSVFASRQYA